MDEIKEPVLRNNITHEFRTPFPLILSPVEQMQRDAEPPSYQTGIYSNQFFSSSTQLLDMSKLENNFDTVIPFEAISIFLYGTVSTRFNQAAAGKIFICFRR